MIPYKEYLLIKEVCEKYKLSKLCNDEKAVLSVICKVVEAYTEFKSPALVAEVAKYKAKNWEKDRLKRGEIAVNKKQLSEHLDEITRIQSQINFLMINSRRNTPKEKEDFGKAMAAQWNALQLTKHSMQHFVLDIPLDKLI